jgi:hypothetical protein
MQEDACKSFRHRAVKLPPFGVRIVLERGLCGQYLRKSRGAFRHCVRAIFAAVFSRTAFDGRWPSHRHGIKAASALCAWPSVSYGFFPPESLQHPRQEEIIAPTDDQVTFQP